MVKKTLVLLTLIILSLIPFTYAIDFSYNRLYDGVQLSQNVTQNITNIFQNITIIGNASNHSNSTDYWITDIGAADTINATQFNINSETLNLDEAWIIQLGDSQWCRSDGCNMTGNLNTTGNITAGVITGTFVGDGSGLTNITGLSANEFNMYFTTSMKNTVIWNFSDSDDSIVNLTMEPGDHYIFGEYVF